MKTDQAKTLYEVAYHIVPTHADDAVLGEVGAIRSAIEAVGGSVIGEEMPKRMNLSYTLVKHVAGKNERYDSAYFGWFRFEASKDGGNSVDEAIRAMPSVLRHIVLALPDRDALLHTQPRVATRPRRASVPESGEGQVMSKEEMDEEIEKLVVE